MSSPAAAVILQALRYQRRFSIGTFSRNTIALFTTRLIERIPRYPLMRIIKPEKDISQMIPKENDSISKNLSIGPHVHKPTSYRRFPGPYCKAAVLDNRPAHNVPA